MTARCGVRAAGGTRYTFGGIPLWAAFGSIALFALAYSPNIIAIYGIHNDYEMIHRRSHAFFHPEAEALVAIARPIAAFFTNFPMFLVDRISDYRGTRIISLVTLCVVALQFASICIRILRVKPLEAAMLSVSTFVVPPFIYSVLNATALPSHFFPILISSAAYGILSHSNLATLSFGRLLRERHIGNIARQAVMYGTSRAVITAGLVFQLALYTYPPNAMFIVLFPVVGVLFSRTGPTYRLIVALRDIGFIGAGIAIYLLTVKLIYMPFVRLFTALYTGEVVDPRAIGDRLNATYRMEFNADPWAFIRRLENLLEVSGDLWFLPQVRAHYMTLAAVSLAVIVGGLLSIGRWRSVGEKYPAISRMRFDSWTSYGIPCVVLITASFVISGAPILASATGFVTYRTTAVPIAIACALFIFAALCLAEAALAGLQATATATSQLRAAVMVTLALAGVGGNFYAGCLTMKLARNETAYFRTIVQDAIDRKSKAIILVDPRPYALPEDIPVVFDEKGRAVPPYELGCLSGYCIQDGSIIHITAANLERPRAFKVHVQRENDPVPGLTCALLETPQPTYPPNATKFTRDSIDYYRSLAPFSCVTYNLKWHDLSLDLTR